MAFVACMLGAAWASWQIAKAEDLTLRHVVGLAILCRLALFPLLPTLSDDGYRYIWDGMLLVREGINPYGFVPSDPALRGVHDEAIYALLNSPEYFSVYPPVSQAVFALGGMVYGAGWIASWYVIKAVLVLLEGIGIACLARVVDKRGVAMYALHPLAVVEIAGQGHTEGAFIGLLGLCLWAVARHPVVSGFALAMAGWVKLFPLALGAAFGANRRAWFGWAFALVAGGAFLLPDEGWRHVMQSVALYGGELDFYSAPFLLLKSGLYPLLGAEAGRWAAVSLSILWGGVLLAIMVTRDGSPGSVQSGLALGIGAYAMLSPMQHPWNWLGVLYIIPLLHFKQSYWWVATISGVTYLRYVGLEAAYMATVAVGWGGGLVLTYLAWRSGELFAANARTDSTVADDASSQ